MSEQHLWETDHPYYMTEGNYLALGYHTRHQSWADFLTAFGDSDLDYNYVVRWDWLEGSDWGAGDYAGDDYYRNGRFMVQFVFQRKALLASHEVEVCRADEPAVRAWLAPRFVYALTMWEPFRVSDERAQREDASAAEPEGRQRGPKGDAQPSPSPRDPSNV